MTLRGCLFLLLSFLLLTGTAAAIEEIKQENVYSFDLSTPDGLVLSGMTAEDITPDANSTFVLNAYGDEYTLYVNSTRTLHANWLFDIKLRSPNGSIETTQLKTIQPFATNYDIHLQYYALEWDSVFDIDVYTGILPLSASLQAQSSTGADYAALLPGSSTYTTTAFSQISGTSTQPMTVTLYAYNQEEFEDQLYGDLSTALYDAVGDAFSWSWDMVLAFVEKIPGVGPYLASILIIAALTIDSIIFYVDLVLIEYPETTFLTVESFILASAFTRKGKFWTKINRVCEAHVKIIEFSISLIESGVNIFSKIVGAIASIISALKPI